MRGREESELPWCGKYPKLDLLYCTMVSTKSAYDG
jgi:hypothetical protein